MSRPLRILVVAHGWPPREQAGAELVAAQLAGALARRGHAVAAFAGTTQAGLPPHAVVREVVDGIAVTRVRTALAQAEALDGAWDDAAVARLFEREVAAGFDIVHVHHLLGLSPRLVHAAQAAGARVVVTLHDFWYLCARGQRMTPAGHLCAEVDFHRCARCIAGKRLRFGANFLRKGGVRALARLPDYLRANLGTRPFRRRVAGYVAALNAADVVTAPSQFVLDEHLRHGLLPAKARFVENGVDSAFLAGLPPRSAPARPLRFGFVGSFLPSKGVDLLLQEFRNFGADLASLDLFGTSPWDGGAYARSLAAQYARSHVRFHGAFDHGRLPEVLAQLDVLVLPSRWYENAPVTLDEAALAELPVVVAGHGGMQEWLERRKNGLAFRPGDGADLRAQLLKLVRDPDLWQRLRTPAWPVRGVDDSAAEFEALYRADGAADAVR